jgi:hypothetical protein
MSATCRRLLVVAGLLLCVAQGVRVRRPSELPVRLFALLPPAGFALQESLERLIASGSIPPDLVLEPTFLVGLALQLPFAVAALLLTRALYSLGFGAGRLLAAALARRPPGPPAPPPPARPPGAPPRRAPPRGPLPASGGQWRGRDGYLARPSVPR